MNGHDVKALQTTFAKCKIESQGKPHFVIANTVKGKGVSFMEHPTQWHGAAPKREQLEDAIKEICGGASPFGRILA